MKYGLSFFPTDFTIRLDDLACAAEAQGVGEADTALGGIAQSRVVNGVIENRLRDRPFLTGEYSIADMAAFPWIVSHTLQGQKLEEFPKLKVWFETIRSRPAVVRGLDVSKEKRGQPMSEEAKKILFGQTAAKVLAR
jgi:GST-like protein